MSFQRATRKQARLKLALVGPSGSGKTYSALQIAQGLGGRIAVIDTERGSASLYSHLTEFDVLELSDFQPETYIAAIQEAVAAKYDVLIIDSLSHEWTATKEYVSKVAEHMKNEWAAWSKGTPRHRALIDCIIQAPIHVIATMRAKTEWGLNKDEKTGKLKPVKLGLGPDQRQGVEYEFTTIFNISENHIAEVEKDRTGIFVDFVDVLTPDVGKRFLAWLASADESPDSSPSSETQKAQIKNYLDELNMSMEDESVQARLKEITGKSDINLWSQADADKVIRALQIRIIAKKQKQIPKATKAANKNRKEIA